MASIGSASLAIIPSFTGFGTALKAGTTREMATAGATGGSKFAGGFKSALKVGGIIGGLSAAMGVTSFIKDSVELEATYSKTMAQIRVATDASADELERLDSLAIKLGKDTTFSANEASTAMLELAKNGIKTATIEAGALDSALTLAAAGGMDLTEAATTMGNSLNAFSLKGRQAGEVAAALAGAANASSANVSDLAYGLSQASASAADAGFTLQETTGALAAFANKGIQGSDAGTSLKTFIARLIPTTKQAREAMEGYGLAGFQSQQSLEKLHAMGIKPVSKSLPDVTNAIRDYIVRSGEATEGTMKLEDRTKEMLYQTGMMQSAFVKLNGDFQDMDYIAGILQDRLGDLSDSERAAALNALFGSDARRAATVLMKEGEKGIRDYVKATSDQAQAEKMAAANMEGTAGAIERLAGSWETAKLTFGKFIAPAVVATLDWFAETVDTLPGKMEPLGAFIKDDLAPPLKAAAGFAGDLAGFLNDLPKTVKIGGLAGLAALVGYGKLRSGGGALGTAGKALGLAKPVPVLVMNKGFGAGGIPGKGGKPGIPPVATLPGGDAVKGAGRGSRFLKFAPLLPAAGALGNDQLPDLMDDRQASNFKRYQANIERSTDFWLDHDRAMRGRVVPMVDNMTGKFHDLFGVVKDVDRTDPVITTAFPGYSAISAKMDKLKGDMDYIARPRYIRMTITRDFDTMGGRRTMPGLQEGGGGPTGGVTVNVGRVEAHDYDDFMTQAQRRAHRAALEGRR